MEVLGVGRRKSLYDIAESVIGSSPTGPTQFPSPITVRRVGHGVFLEYTMVDLPLMGVNQSARGTTVGHFDPLEMGALNARRGLEIEFEGRMAAWAAEKISSPPEPVMTIGNFSESTAASFLRLAADFAAVLDPHGERLS
jgi:hypothetical protein